MYSITKLTRIVWASVLLVIITGFGLVACESTELAAPCSSFGKFCDKTPINPSIAAHKEIDHDNS